MEIPHITGVRIESIIHEPTKYSKLMRVLSYPSSDIELSIKRLKELKRIGVDAILFTGDVEVYGVKVIGKGVKSIVIAGVYHDKIVAIKILRTDSTKSTLEYEAEIIRLVEDKYDWMKITPSVYRFSKWYIVMEYIIGSSLYEFLSEDVFNLSKTDLLTILEKILYKAYLLDKLNISHGELSRPGDHIIIRDDDSEPIFIDFESAKIKSKPNNVTALAQAILIRSPSSEYILDLIGLDKGRVIDMLKMYSHLFEEARFKKWLAGLIRY